MTAVAHLHRLALAALAVIALSACPRPPAQPKIPTPTPAPAATPTPAPTPAPPPTPPPPPFVPAKRLEVGKIFNGLRYRVKFETETGTTATRDREEPESYTAEVTVKVKVPKPHHDIEELKRLNEDLPNVLPGLPALLETAKVSPVFENLYRLKCAAIQSSLMRLDAVPTRHNFYDCETLLELQHPQTKRRALLLQGDMDTDTDGSDSDRVAEIEGASSTFQPFTSYRWAKKTEKPNSFVAAREAKLKQLELELAANGINGARKDDLRTTIGRLKTEISDLKKYSFLVANADPYVVLSGSITSRSKAGGFTPSVGDYCVVIYGKTIYPAIVGDIGPKSVVGEASARIGKQIDPRTTGEQRAVSDLKVTYLVFPGTAEKFDAPDLAKWRTRCEKLLTEIGGFGGELFTWEDLTKPKPPPATPAPATPAPGSTPAPSTPASVTPPSATPAPAPAAPATPAAKPA